jgi:glycosyltransferase involved in cell wall biosynthesis
VVIEGETGLLVDEGDVEGMASHMLRLLREPAYAAQLGAAARRHVRAHFSQARSIERQWAVIEESVLTARSVGHGHQLEEQRQPKI